MPTVTASLSGGFAVAVTNGNHTWRADEPLDLGGTDSGPNPYELLLGAVASCTCITLAMYARRKDIVLDAVEVAYEHDRVHADDCEDCEGDVDAAGRMDRIRGRVRIVGDVTGEQRARLADIATRCPVHRSLERRIAFEDEVTVTVR